MNRRHFIRSGAIVAGGLVIDNPSSLYAFEEIKKLTILHTNDVHSHVEPFPMDGSRNQGLGGVARRSALIKQVRQEEQNVLLFDAGDIFQGTPYFNFFAGELEMKLMSQMGYDGATIGNHDLDNGIEGFHKQLPNAQFPIIISNYNFEDTLLNKSTIPFKIFKKSGIKIGVFGLGIELQGLVDKKNYGDIQYQDPITVANRYASLLRNDQDCDMVICLSHLGYHYKEKKISDTLLAANTKNIDLIIGGHTHTFLRNPTDIKNLDGDITTINQVGWAGINLGRLDYFFKPGKKQSKAHRVYQIDNILDR